MAKSIRRPEPKQFDEAVLNGMVEPLTVRVGKKIAGREMPMELPLAPGESVSGKGWTKDDVRQIESFLLNEWGGGGLYRCNVVDSQGAELSWDCFFPTDRFPEKTPPTMQAAQPAPRVVMPPPPVPQLSGGAAPAGDWLRTAALQYPPPPAPQQVASYGYPSNGGGYGAPATPLMGAYPARREDDDKLLAEREARLRLESQMALDRIQNQHREQVSSLQQEIRRIAEQAQAAAGRPAADSEVAEVRRELEEERRARQNDERLAAMQRQTEQMIAAMQNSFQQQLQALTAIVQQIAQRPTGPDPVMTLMLESQKEQARAQMEVARLQAEAQKEAARVAAEAAKEQARSAIGPREMIELATKLIPNNDQITQAVGRVLEIQQQAVEQALQIQSPGVHPALQMVGEAAQGTLGVVQRWFEMREQSERARSNAQVQVAAIQAQAQAQASQAQLAAAPSQPAEDVDDEGDEGPDEEDLESTERELFGPAYDQVMRLRKGVESGALAPEKAAEAVVQGINMAIQQKIDVPAFELWKRGEFAPLVECLVPEAKTSFKDRMGGALLEIVQRFQAEQSSRRQPPASAPAS